jgi:hypothetical protein
MQYKTEYNSKDPGISFQINKKGQTAASQSLCDCKNIQHQNGKESVVKFSFFTVMLMHLSWEWLASQEEKDKRYNNEKISGRGTNSP